MADDSAFELACDALEQRTRLDRLEARGTVRLVLKEAGLEPRNATPHELSVAIERLLPGHLEARGEPGQDDFCRELASRLATVSAPGLRSDSPEAVFSRLAGGNH